MPQARGIVFKGTKFWDRHTAQKKRQFDIFDLCCTPQVLCLPHHIYMLRDVAHKKGHSEGTLPFVLHTAGAVFSPLGAAAAKLHGGPPLVFVNFTALKGDLADQAVAAATSLQVGAPNFV